MPRLADEMTSSSTTSSDTGGFMDPTGQSYLRPASFHPMAATANPSFFVPTLAVGGTSVVDGAGGARSRYASGAPSASAQQPYHPAQPYPTAGLNFFFPPQTLNLPPHPAWFGAPT